MDKLKTFGLVLVVLLVIYNLYTGATVQKVGIPGLFEIEFNQRASAPSTGPQAPGGGSTDTDPPESNPPDPSPPRSVSGNWTGSIGNLEMTVTQVEAIRQIGDRDILRFYVTVNNQTTDSLTLPLFGYFLAVDNSGNSYKANHRLSDWPESIPSGMKISGTIDLEDPVPQDVSMISLSFTQIFGSLDFGMEGITVRDISLP